MKRAILLPAVAVLALAASAAAQLGLASRRAASPAASNSGSTGTRLTRPQRAKRSAICSLLSPPGGTMPSTMNLLAFGSPPVTSGA